MRSRAGPVSRARWSRPGVARSRSSPEAASRSTSPTRRSLGGISSTRDGRREPRDHRGGQADRAREGHRGRDPRRARSRTPCWPPTRRRRARLGTRSVELDRESGDFRVWSIELPEGHRGALLDEARERELTELEAPRRRPASARTRSSPTTTSSSTGRTSPRSEIQRDRRDAGQLRPHRRADRQAGDPAADPRGRARDDVRGVRRPRERGRDRHRPAGRRPQQRLVDLGRVEALLPAPSRSTASATSRAAASRPSSPRSGPGRRARRSSSRRRDPELIKTLFELEVPEIADGLVEIRGVAREPGYRSKIAVESARPGRRPGRRLRRPARLARAHGRLRAARREDRHHPVEPGAGAVRREGPLAGARARGARRRRVVGGDGHRARRPALARDRQGGARTPASPPA